MPRGKKNDPQALEESVARAQADLANQILHKLNRGMSIHDVRLAYGLSYASIRRLISVRRIYLLRTEDNFLVEASMRFGMQPGEALVHSGIGALKDEVLTRPASPISPLSAERMRQVGQRVYDEWVGRRGDLHVPPRPVPSAKKTAKKKATTRKKRKATKK